jgi:hypothetical protein
MVLYACNPSYLGGGDSKISSLRPPWTVSETLSWKQNANKRTGSVATVIKCLASIPQALGSIPSTSKMNRLKINTHINRLIYTHLLITCTIDSIIRHAIYVIKSEEKVVRVEGSLLR